MTNNHPSPQVNAGNRHKPVVDGLRLMLITDKSIAHLPQEGVISVFLHLRFEVGGRHLW